MRLIKFGSIFSASLIFLSSCSKDFLNKQPSTAVDLGVAVATEGDLGVALNGTYASLRAVDLYGRTLPLKGDIMADNAFVTTANSGRYLSFNNYSFNNGDGYALGIWQNAYIVIKAANTVINSTIASTANVDEYKGEAYAIRALMHFELVRNYAHPYTVAPNDLGVPLVTTFDQTSKPARNTIKEVYTQVLADLDKAYTLMSQYRGTAYFSKYAAKALAARVYQHMGDWANAKTAALDVITNSGWVMLPPASYASPSGSAATSQASYSAGGYWSNPATQTSSKNETLFEVSSDLNNNNGFDQLGGIYLNIGGSYGDILGTEELHNLYSATDVRAALNPVGSRSGQAGTVYLNYKYPNAFNNTDRDDTKVLRLSDIILIAAEAYYNTSDEMNALKYLNMVAKQRDPSFTGYTSTGGQLLEDILTERRKELAFEGNRFWDLLRLKRTFVKVVNQNPLKTITITPDNVGLILPIPVTEINANPNVAQNPGY